MVRKSRSAGGIGRPRGYEWACQGVMVLKTISGSVAAQAYEYDTQYIH